MDLHLILVIVVVSALAFDFTNGFHDTANVVATSISTGAVSPKAAIASPRSPTSSAPSSRSRWRRRSPRTWSTSRRSRVRGSLNVVFAGLVGATAWNLITWYFWPSSSSRPDRRHSRSGPRRLGSQAIETAGLVGKLVPAIVAPILAPSSPSLAIGLIYRITARFWPGPVTRGYRLGQIASVACSRSRIGTNDAQKTMGVITLALIADGALPEGASPPTWVIVASATAIALGTYSGGWRIIKTTGMRIIKMDAAQGFSAQGAGCRGDHGFIAFQIPLFQPLT